MDLSDAQVDAIRGWAERTDHVLAVYLFGSRAKGLSRPESDVDIALAFCVEDHDVEDVFKSFHDSWYAELGRLVGLRVTLHHLAGVITPIHSGAVADHGIQIYRRST